MIDSMFKRVIAYLIDMMLISIVASSLVSSKVINFQLEDYETLYNEYYEIYSLYVEQSTNDIKTCEELEKAIDEKKLTEEKYITDLEKLKESYSKQELSKEEYDNKCLVIVDEYNSNKMTEEEYKEHYDYYFYNLEKNSIIGYIVNIVLCLLYFVFFQGFTGGQTLGKKINRIKVVSVKENERVSYKQLFIRTIFLHSNIYYLLMLLSILFVPKNSFMQVGEALYALNSILSMMLVFTISFYKGKSGLHDKIAHTKIIDVDFKGNEIKPKNEIVEEDKKEELDKKENKYKKNKNIKRN